MVFRIILYAFLIYVLYKLIFDLIIPVYTTTKKVKKQFREMHNKMQEEMTRQQQQTAQAQEATKVAPEKSSADYIDFEEVK
jgi:predicted Holliday junction resolvase-like endonuclease